MPDRIPTHLNPPPGFRTHQAKKISETFKLPHLDGSMYINEMVDWHAEHSPNHPYAILTTYQDREDDKVEEEEGEGEVRNEVITYAELAENVHHLASHLLHHCNGTPLNPQTGLPRIVSILVQNDTLSYTTAILAVLRAGFVAFPISNRNSDEGIQHLIKESQSDVVLISVSDERSGTTSSFSDRIHRIVSSLPSSSSPITTIHAPPLYARLHQSPIPPFRSSSSSSLPSYRSLLLSFKQLSLSSTSMIIHSSGSTKFPKPIPWSHQIILGGQWACMPWFGDYDLGGEVLGTGLALPPFHGIGVASQILWPLCCGAICAMWHPSLGPAFPSPKNLLLGMKRTKSRFTVAVPAPLEVWAHDPAAIESLKELTVLAYGGGVLSQEAGNRLAAGGVPLQSLYGTTEAGLIFRVYFKLDRPYAWEYSPFASFMKPLLDPVSKGMFRLEAEINEPYRPAILNSSSGNGFDTNDILEEHSELKGHYRVVGRMDDQIVMANAEKTNPNPIEAIIVGDPNVQNAIMFGSGRNEAGVIIEPPTHSTQEKGKEEEYINLIWPSIQKANAFAPSHSRIFRELVIVGDIGRKPFPKTAKSTPSRFAVLKLYEGEIEEAYERLDKVTGTGKVEDSLEEGGNSQVPVPKEVLKGGGGEAEIFDYVNRVVHSIMNVSMEGSSAIPPEDDLFQHGCDSLQSRFIVASLQRLLLSLPQPQHQKLDANVVFEHPSISRLTSHLVTIISVSANGGERGGDAEEEKEEEERKVKEMRDMVDKYVKRLSPSRVSAATVVNGAGHKDGKERVILTGGTGFIGCYLIGALLELDNVEKIWVINRPAVKKSQEQGETALERQVRALKERGLSNVDMSRLQVIEGDVGVDKFGLRDNDLWKELHYRTTLFIHNAWRVDFNLRLSSFEPLIHGLVQIANFLLTSPRAHSPTPPKLAVMSSIGALQSFEKLMKEPGRGGGGGLPIEKIYEDARIALGSGYAESKWVSEMIVAALCERGIPGDIFRVNQMAGSIVNGEWNITDWFPQIIMHGVQSARLPVLEEGEDKPVYWLPGDVAARAMVEIMCRPDSKSSEIDNAGRRQPNVWQLSHPSPTTWNAIMSAAHALLTSSSVSGGTRNVELVPLSQWTSSLESEDKGISGSFSSLIDFYRDAVQRMQRIPHLVEAFGLPLVDATRALRESKTLRNAHKLEAKNVEMWIQRWMEKVT